MPVINQKVFRWFLNAVKFLPYSKFQLYNARVFLTTRWSVQAFSTHISLCYIALHEKKGL